MVQKVTDIMGVTSNKSAELAAYLQQDVAFTLFNQWKVDRGTDIEPIEREKFAIALLDRFFPLELREVKVQEFINLK